MINQPSVGELGERRIIQLLTNQLASRDDVVCGIGDDCAVVRGGACDYVLTTDPVIENEHFLRNATPHLIGRKAIGRVLSDIASMGASPDWLLINVTVPTDLPMSMLSAVYEGANAMATEFGAVIVGGDTAHGEALSLHVFGIGSLPHGQALLRSGVQNNDIIYASGSFGGSILGRHLNITPRIREGIWLREQNVPVHAMIDVSDGLVSELVHLAMQSRVQLHITGSTIPIHPDAHTYAEQTENSALWHALNDGEDFELLFSVPQTQARQLEQMWKKQFDVPLTAIGHASDAKQPRVLLRNNQDLTIYDANHQGGFEHLSTSSDPHHEQHTDPPSPP